MHIVFRNHNYYLKNHLETVVINKILEMNEKKELTSCLCERCMSDVVSYTLNRLPPKYIGIMSEEEEKALVEELSEKYDRDIKTAISLGSKIVMEHPRHNGTEDEQLFSKNEDDEDIFLENYVELLAVEHLADISQKIDCCKCDRCLSDIALYALNRIQPRYVATIKGEAYNKLNTLNRQYETDIITHLLTGAEIVKASPRHTPEDLKGNE